MAGQMERRFTKLAGPSGISCSEGTISSPSRAMSSTGTSTRRSKAFFAPASTIVTGLGFHTRRPSPPPRNRATSSRGRCVAERPIRWRGRRAASSSRSSVSARWAPRFVPTRAWISSTMTVSTDSRNARAREVRTRKSDSGVVIRMSGGCRSIRARSSAGVSPVRMATSGRRTASPRRPATRAIPAIGVLRFRSTSTARALSGDT
jgi:hypothetical protein